MHRYAIEIDLSKIQEKELVCYSEEIEEIEGDHFHKQIPQKLILKYIDPDIFTYDPDNNELLRLAHTSIDVLCTCSHCGKQNLYPDYIYLKEAENLVRSGNE